MNTFDKKKLIEKLNSFTKLSSKTVESFIFRKNEVTLKKFFAKDIHDVLTNYEYGNIKYKPDVLQQILEIEDKIAANQNK
jgi:hypothetical protein